MLKGKKDNQIQSIVTMEIYISISLYIFFAFSTVWNKQHKPPPVKWNAFIDSLQNNPEHLSSNFKKFKTTMMAVLWFLFFFKNSRHDMKKNPNPTHHENKRMSCHHIPFLSSVVCPLLVQTTHTSTVQQIHAFSRLFLFLPFSSLVECTTTTTKSKTMI